MKKTRYLILISCATLWWTAGKGQTPGADASKPGVDTLTNNTVDSSRKSWGCDPGYERDTAMVAIFRPYFVSDICEPGCTDHPLYKLFFNRGALLAPKAMEKLMGKVFLYAGSTNRIAQRFPNADAVKGCRLVQVPVYYLAPNVVMFTKGQDLRQFYTLDTTAYSYKVMRGDQFLDVLTFRETTSEVTLSRVPDQDSLSYYQVLAEKKEPIGLINEIGIPGITNTSFFDHFGCLREGHLLFSSCSQGDFFVNTGGKGDNKEVFKRACKTEFADAYYCDEGSQSALSRHIERARQLLAKTGKKK